MLFYSVILPVYMYPDMLGRTHKAYFAIPQPLTSCVINVIQIIICSLTHGLACV